MLRWITLLPRLTNCGTPNGVTRPAVRSRLSMAGPEVTSVAGADAVPWQSWHVDLDRRPPVAVQLARPVHILHEVTVDAVHALLEMDVLQMHRLLNQILVVERNDLAVGVEEVALAIALVNLLEHPAVAVDSRRTARASAVGFCSLTVLEKFRDRSTAPGRRLLRIEPPVAIDAPHPSGCAALSDTCARRRFPCPTTCSRGTCSRSRCRDARGTRCTGWTEWSRVNSCLIGWPDSFFGIVGSSLAVRPWLPNCAYGPELTGVAIVRVDDVTRRAAALAVVAGRVVRAEKRHDRVVQPDFLGTQDDRVDVRLSPETPVRQEHVGLTGNVFTVGIPELGLRAAASLEYPEDVPRLTVLEARQREQDRQDALRARLFLGRRRYGADDLRLAAGRVVLDELRRPSTESTSCCTGRCCTPERC